MEINALVGHSNWITSVSFSPDNQYVLSSSWDQTCKIWDGIPPSFFFSFLIYIANTGLEQLTLSGHNRLINCARFSPDGKNIVSASWDCTLRVWENVQGKSIRTLRGTFFTFYLFIHSKVTRNQLTRANIQVMERE